jgi:hypothetical protein
MLEFQVFWDMMLFHWVRDSQHSIGTCWHLGLLDWKIEAALTFEMLGIAHPLTHQCVPEDLTAVRVCSVTIQRVVEDPACALLCR